MSTGWGDSASLAKLIRRPLWMQRAACRGLTPDLFFPARGDNEAVESAKTVCQACPVIDECLTHALATTEIDGIFGGLTPRQRRRLRRDVPTAPRVAPCGTESGARAHRRRGEAPCRKCAAAASQAVQARKARAA